MGSVNVKIGRQERIPKNTYYSPDIPDEGVFNPYSVIDPSNYKNNRKGKKEYQHDLAELQYLAELRQQEYETAYNSESAQVARQRTAGLNPDLLGVEGGQVGSSPDTSMNPAEGIQTNGERASQVVGSVASIIGTVASLASGAMGVASGLAGLQGAKLANLGSALNVADSAMSIFGKWSAGDPQNMEHFTNNIPMLGRSQRKSLKRLYDSWSSSPYMEKASQDFETQMMQSTGEFYKRAVDPKYNSPEVAGYVQAWSPLVDALNEMAVSEAKGRKQKGDYDTAYYGTESGQSDRSRVNAENQLFSNIREPLVKVLENFEKMQNNAKEGSREYETALYSRAFLSSMILKFFSGL